MHDVIGMAMRQPLQQCLHVAARQTAATGPFVTPHWQDAAKPTQPCMVCNTTYDFTSAGDRGRGLASIT